MIDEITQSFLCGKMYDDVGIVRKTLKMLRKYPQTDEMRALMHEAHISLENAEYKLLKVREMAKNNWESANE